MKDFCSVVIVVIALLRLPVVPVMAMSDLWRCVYCGGQTQSSSREVSSPGTCPHNKNGHSWRLVR